MRNNAYLKSLMFQDLGMRLLTRGGGFTKNETCLALNLNRGFSRHIFQNIFCFNEVINMNSFPCFPGTSLSFFLFSRYLFEYMWRESVRRSGGDLFQSFLRLIANTQCLLDSWNFHFCRVSYLYKSRYISKSSKNSYWMLLLKLRLRKGASSKP